MSDGGRTFGRGFGLGAKLTLGFVILLGLLIAVGVESIELFDHLGGSIDVILRENYVSVIAAGRMKEALERLDSGALFALAGEEEQGRALAARHRPRFAAALRAELGNITLPGEGEKARRIERLYGAYLPVLERILAPATPAGERHALYFQRLLPLFRQIKATADEILGMNQENMVAANDRARKLAADAGRRMALTLLAGTAFAGLCVLYLSGAILWPLERLTKAAKQLQRGDLDLAVPVTSRDELGQLAAAFNAMAGGLRELRASDQARLLRARRSSQLALEALPTASGFRADQELHAEPISPRDLIEAAIRQVEVVPAGKRVELVTDIDPATPPVLADPARAELALSALLQNALAHTPGGGKVTVSAEPNEGRVRFTVADTGGGVPPAERERIFEPFYQVPGTEDLGGAGIGLAVARGIVQAHGGEIHCTGEEGRGATFWFTLPAALQV